MSNKTKKPNTIGGSSNMKNSKRFIALVTAFVLAFSTLISTTALAAVNPDVVGTDYEVAVSKLKAVGIMEGYPDGSFQPNGEITRAEFAKIAVIAMGLGDAAEASKGTTVFPDVASSHWAAGYINLAVNKGLVKGYPDGSFQPEGKMTNAEGITILVRMVGLGPVVEKEGVWPANYVGRAANEGILKDVNVASSTKAIRGLVSKMLVNSLTVEQWGATGYTNSGSVDYGKLGTTLLANTLKVDEYKDENVTAYNTDDNELTLDGAIDGTFEVAAGVDVDLYEAYRNEVTAWINDNDEIIFMDVTSTYFIDAIEINDDATEVELKGLDKEYDLDLTGSDVNGAGDVVAGATYDLAKVVLNDKNDVAYIDAYTFDEFIVIDSVDGDVVTDIEGEEMDLEDFTIFKAGKLAAASNMVKGDILFFDAGEETAEIYTKSVTGAITNVYTEKFEVAGKEYDYNKALTADLQAMYVDEDGDYVAFDMDAAKNMKDEGDITVFVDREGKTVYVTGKIGTAATDSMAGILIENTVKETTFGKDYLELVFVNELGKEVTETIKLADIETITVDGVEYKVGKDAPAGITADSEIDYFKMNGNIINAYNAADAIIQSAGPANIDIVDITTAVALEEAIVVFTYNTDGDVIGFEFFNTNAVAYDDEPADNNLDVTKAKYAEGFKINSDALVFNIEDGLTAADITIAEYSKITAFDEIVDEQAMLFTNNDNEIIYIVASQTNAEVDTTDVTGLVTSTRTNTDGDIVKLTAYVDGVKKDFTVDEVTATVTTGQVYTLTVDDATSEVTGITAAVIAAGELDEEVNMATVSVSNRTFSTLVPTAYKLVSDAVIIDRTGSITDIKVKAIRDLQDLAAGNQVTIVLDEAGTSFVQMVIITDNGTTGGAY